MITEGQGRRARIKRNEGQDTKETFPFSIFPRGKCIAPDIHEASQWLLIDTRPHQVTLAPPDSILRPRGTHTHQYNLIACVIVGYLALAHDPVPL